MKSWLLIIIGIIIIVFLLVAVVYPTINYRTWGNNELSYWNDGNPHGMICDEFFWQPPSNCRPIESEPVKIKVCRGEYDPEWCGEGANP